MAIRFKLYNNLFDLDAVELVTPLFGFDSSDFCVYAIKSKKLKVNAMNIILTYKTPG